MGTKGLLLTDGDVRLLPRNIHLLPRIRELHPGYDFCCGDWSRNLRPGLPSRCLGSSLYVVTPGCWYHLAAHVYIRLHDITEGKQRRDFLLCYPPHHRARDLCHLCRPRLDWSLCAERLDT